MIKKRICWITNLKGIAIIAVVIGHVASPISSFIYAWHIPLFFFASGLLMKKNRPLTNSIKRDFLKLIVPFFIFSLIGLFAEYIKRFLFPGFSFVNGEINFWKEIIGIFWWMDFSHLHHYGFVLWFLPALFWAKNIYQFLFRLFKNQYVISAICLILLFFLSRQSILLPFSLNGALLGLFWISISWLVTGNFWWISFILLFVLKIPNTNLSLGIINGYGVFYSLVAINTIMGLVKLIPKNIKLIERFGVETMSVLIIHPYINNIAYFVTVFLLHINWVYEIVFSLVFLYFIVMNINSVKMVWQYIAKNNQYWKVPYVVIKSFIIIIFQLITKREIIKKLGKGRRILLFPGCVVSRMFLYSDIPDKEEISELRNQIDEKSIFLDIGANVGHYSVLLSDITKNIFAFEPSPISFQRCRRNFVLNDLDVDKVKNIAISDSKGTSGFTDFGGSSTVNRLTKKNNAKIQVETDTLDNWVTNNIEASDINLVVSIDVEGNEEKVIKGAHRLFKEKRFKYVILEIFDNKDKIFRILNSYGYKTGQLSGNNYYAKKI